MKAFRGIKNYCKQTSISARDAFQLVLPYLCKFNEFNEISTVKWDVDNNTHVIQRCFVCPRFMNAAVTYDFDQKSP
jgi:hypothetical protein